MLFFYPVLLLLACCSVMLIRESSFFGMAVEWLLRMRPCTLYDRSAKHATLVAVLKWPFLLALIGLAVPSPWSWDFIVAFVVGFGAGWRDFRRHDPKLIEVKSVEEV